MKITVKEMGFLKAVLELTSSKGKKFELVIEKTENGHAYEDFSEWDITDDEYYFLDDQMDSYVNQMKMY